MANPQGRDIHIDGFISDMAINYKPQGHIADRVFPVINVGKQSDNYPIWDKGDWYRVEETGRARGDEANVVEMNVSSAKYYAENYALKAKVHREDVVNSDLDWGTALASKAMVPTAKLKQSWERRVAQLCTSGTNCASYTAVLSANQWGSDSSTPFTTVMENLEWLTLHGGYRPNRAVFGIDAWNRFRRSSEVRGLIYPHGGGIAGVQAVADLLELDEVLIGRGHYNTAAEGQTVSLSAIWGANVLLYYAPMAPSKEEPSFGYTFRWNAGGLPSMQAEVHAYDTKKKSQEVEVGMYQDEVITASDLGFLFTKVDGSA